MIEFEDADRVTLMNLLEPSLKHFVAENPGQFVFDILDAPELVLSALCVTMIEVVFTKDDETALKCREIIHKYDQR